MLSHQLSAATSWWHWEQPASPLCSHLQTALLCLQNSFGFHIFFLFFYTITLLQGQQKYPKLTHLTLWWETFSQLCLVIEWDARCFYSQACCERLSEFLWPSRMQCRKIPLCSTDGLLGHLALCYLYFSSVLWDDWNSCLIVSYSPFSPFLSSPEPWKIWQVMCSDYWFLLLICWN